MALASRISGLLERQPLGGQRLAKQAECLRTHPVKGENLRLGVFRDLAKMRDSGVGKGTRRGSAHPLGPDELGLRQGEFDLPVVGGYIVPGVDTFANHRDRNGVVVGFRHLGREGPATNH